MLDTRWNKAALQAQFENSADIIIECYPSEESTLLILVFCEGMSDFKQLNETVLPVFREVLEEDCPDDEIAIEIGKSLQVHELKSDEEWTVALFSGHLMIFVANRIYSYNMDKIPKRSPEESATEISLKGPRDGFTEEISTNIALIRKRLRTPNLQNEQFKIGKESHTVVSLLYLKNMASPEVIQQARERILNYETNALFSSMQYEEVLGDKKYSLFPLLDYIGRPDFAAECLLRGRFVVLVNGSPMALIGPTNLTEQLKSPEDLHFPFYFVAFERLLRIFGLFVSIFLPGFWIALTAFNMEQIPFKLLATVTNSRLGLPLSAPLEALLMLGLFELFREAGIRLPRAVGQTVAVVGGLIVGDSAIRAGLTSPTMLVVSAVTAVATFILVNQSLSGTVSILRFFSLILSSLMGMFGFFISMMFIIMYMAGLESFGIGYLEPLAPPSFGGDWVKAILDVPRRWKYSKPKMFKK
ncbi:spore germination protein [Paenibacillus cremeus]|nr:spore germination protein [Paenibacillus cremeus]